MDSSGIVESAFRSFAVRDPQLDTRGEILGWLFTCAMRKLLNEARKHRSSIRDVSREELVDPDTLPEERRRVRPSTSPRRPYARRDMTPNLAVEPDSFFGDETIKQITHGSKPPLAAMFAELLERLREHDSELHRIAKLRLQGLTSEEIASALEKSRQAIERKEERIKRFLEKLEVS